MHTNVQNMHFDNMQNNMQTNMQPICQFICKICKMCKTNQYAKYVKEYVKPNASTYSPSLPGGDPRPRPISKSTPRAIPIYIGGQTDVNHVNFF